VVLAAAQDERGAAGHLEPVLAADRAVVLGADLELAVATLTSRADRAAPVISGGAPPPPPRSSRWCSPPATLENPGRLLGPGISASDDSARGRIDSRAVERGLEARRRRPQVERRPSTVRSFEKS